eukprot:551439_1
MTELNAWSFIQSTKATRLASLKSIQKFILSLNKTELTHLITFYLQSKLSKHNRTLKQTEDELLSSDSCDALKTIDKQIISKLNDKYGSKYHKKVISATIQKPNNNKSNPKHLLLIPPQVLAYSFQFLSFRELCKAQTVCVHFMYLNRQYPALTHYYLKMDTKFFSRAMRHRMCLSDLSCFKHICITAAYWSMGRFTTADNRRRSKLFQIILRTLIQQSKSSLDVLSIDVRAWSAHVRNISFDHPPFSVLLFIMNEFDQLLISKLFWNRDSIKPSKDCTISDLLPEIQSKFVHFFPTLASVSVGHITVFAPGGGIHAWRGNSATTDELQFASLKQYILAPTIIDFSDKLESLEIKVNGFWDLLRSDGNVIQLIAKHMTNLKQLAISTTVTSDENNGDIINMNDLNNISQHTQIKILKLTIKWSDYVNRMENLAKYINAGLLQFLFSTFIGITEFEYHFDWPWSRTSSHRIDWEDILSKLIQSKRMYSMNKEHDVLPPLESLQLKPSDYEEGIRIMKSILHLQYCDLKHIGMEFASRSSSENIGVFSKYFVSFLRLYRSKNANLSSVHLNLGPWWSVRTLPILDMLRNIPPSITSLYLELPIFTPASKQLTQEKTKIVKQLCEMSLKRREGSKLETIAFDNLRLSPSDKKYLLFWFGFNNMISIIEKKYHLRFI